VLKNSGTSSSTSGTNGTASTTVTATATKNNSTNTSAKSNTSTTTATANSASTKSNAVSTTDKEETAEIVKSSTLTSIDNSAKTEISLPTESSSIEVSSSQKASTELVKLIGNVNTGIVTNAESYAQTTSEQKDKAYRILTYYLNHLDELGKIGSDELSVAANDELKDVTFEVIASLDVEAGEEQLKAMANEEYAELTISSDDFKDGELYIIVHESEIREGKYDILLVTAENNSLSMYLPDFSPVTIAAVSVEAVEEVTEEIAIPEMHAQAVDTVDEVTASNEVFRNVMYVLIVIAIIGLVVIFAVMKKRNYGVFSRRKN
jgi:hypothetical protein